MKSKIFPKKAGPRIRRYLDSYKASLLKACCSLQEDQDGRTQETGQDAEEVCQENEALGFR